MCSAIEINPKIRFLSGWKAHNPSPVIHITQVSTDHIRRPGCGASPGERRLDALLEVVGDISEDCFEGDLVQATLGRPLLFVLNRS